MNFLLTVLWGIFFQCRHENVTWPQRGEQRCNDCTRVRRYDMRTMRRGRWHYEKIEQQTQEIYIFETSEE